MAMTKKTSGLPTAAKTAKTKPAAKPAGKSATGVPNGLSAEEIRRKGLDPRPYGLKG